MRQICYFFLFITVLIASLACSEPHNTLNAQAEKSMTRIHTEKKYFKDEYGRYLFLHGVNLSGSTKLPTTIKPISYVDKPFPLATADENFRKLRDLGFNFVRLLTTWEAIEPYGPGQYDTAYLDYFAQIVAKANEYGIYCLIDMHQDIFSRWLYKFYVDDTGQNALETLSGLEKAPPPFNDTIQGDGAPRWVVQLALPEKKVGGPQWGLPRFMVTDATQTNDMLPLHWGLANFTSVDASRCYLTFFAGKALYPHYLVEGKNIQDYLQDAFAQAWVQLVKKIKDYPNVLGYDIINEPMGIFFVFSLYAMLYDEAGQSEDGTLSLDQIIEKVKLILATLGAQGMPADQQTAMYDLFMNQLNLPRSRAELAAAGFPTDEQSPYKPDTAAAFEVNANFNRNFLQPMYARVGQGIQAEDPDALIVIEPSLGLDDRNGLFGAYITPMLAPEGIKQLAYAPHFYADVYPIIFNYNPSPRDFTVDEIQFRDYSEGILSAIDYAAFSLGNVPTILGEFGTYFNFGGYEKSAAENYRVSAHILENYYRVLDNHMINRAVWCYSPENTPYWGDGWNREDFSIIGPDQEPRAEEAYSRVLPRFTSGRLLSYQYNSPLAYYEPQPGVPTPVQEFNLAMSGLESAEPTEISVPARQFPAGFYVSVSDGRCLYDHERGILYWYPFESDPGIDHTLKIRPPYDGYGDSDWNYFFQGESVIEGRRP